MIVLLKMSSESEESSSSQKANSSSTAEVVESSSSVIASSSSAMQSSSSVVFPAEVKTSGYYDCDIYHCVTTDYLKQTMLENGVYGEILDTRDNQVYKVVVIGEGADAQIWMAQNLNYDPVSQGCIADYDDYTCNGKWKDGSCFVDVFGCRRKLTPYMDTIYL